MDKDREINEELMGGRGKKEVATVYDRHPSNCKTLIGTSHFLKRLSDKPHLESSLTVLK